MEISIVSTCELRYRSVSPGEEPTCNGASDDYMLAAQEEFAGDEEEEQIVPSGRLKNVTY